MIINKVLPDKFEYVRDFARRGLSRLGIDLLGCIPQEPILANRHARADLARRSKGTFLNGKERSRRRVKKVIIGAMSSSRVMEFFKPGTLVITPGDREDVILAALSTCSLCGAGWSIHRRPRSLRRPDAEHARARAAQELRPAGHRVAAR